MPKLTLPMLLVLPIAFLVLARLHWQLRPPTPAHDTMLRAGMRCCCIVGMLSIGYVLFIIGAAL